MRIWLGVIGFVIGTMVGVAAGFAIEDSPDSDEVPIDQAGTVPASCLDAISAARDRLLLNPDVTKTLRDYRDLGEDIADDVSRFQIPDLRRSLGSLNNLNDRSSELLDRAVNSRFSEAANECERTAGDPEPTNG